MFNRELRALMARHEDTDNQKFDALAKAADAARDRIYTKIDDVSAALDRKIEFSAKSQNALALKGLAAVITLLASILGLLAHKTGLL